MLGEGAPLRSLSEEARMEGCELEQMVLGGTGKTLSA